MSTGFRVNFRRGRAAFSLIELLIVLTLLAAVGTITWGIRWTPSARLVAERAQSWLYGVLAQSDRSGLPFSLRVEARSRLAALWSKGGGTETWRVVEGCSLRRLASAGGPSDIAYSPQWGTFTPALTLEIVGSGGDVHYLILSGQGRIRTSKVPPQD